MEAIAIRLEAIASRMEATTTSNKKLRTVAAHPTKASLLEPPNSLEFRCFLVLLLKTMYFKQLYTSV